MNRVLSIFFVFAALSFGQSQGQLLARLPFGGTLSGRADAISRTEDPRTKAQNQLAELRKRLTLVTAEYTLEHPDVRTLQLQIDELASRVSSLPVSNVDTTVIHLRGNVELRTDTMVLTADEADYYGGTGEIVPRGNVRVRPTSK